VAAERLAALIEAQRPQLALWIPVLYGLGIGLYFAAPAEPAPWMLAPLAAALAVGLAALVRGGPVLRVLVVAALLPTVGFAAGAVRSRMVAAPVLPRAMTVSVEGRIVGLDRSASDRARVLLDRVVIHGLDPGRTPARVRISLDPSTPADVLRPGFRILGQARLSPPAAPAEPGGFDFRRMAWFERLGAVGYSNTPFLETEGSEPSGLRQLAFRLRVAGSEHIQGLVPGQNGAFAAAILTGDRSGIDREVEEALRASNLYHIVSISGLHMTLLAAAVFAIVRYGLALAPWLALNWPLKKIAAWAALAAGAAYLVISGAEVPTQRAYVMTAAVLVAVLLDRPALTMRAVALAALIVLAVAPESLVQAGFQMSFAATVALVAAFEALRGRAWWQRARTERGLRLVKPVLAVTVTSLVAGTATAPFSAFHFNTLSQYGLIANLLAVPAMGAVVMPAAVVGILAAPVGLDWLPFQVVGWGMGYVIAVARFVAGLGGAVAGVPAGPPTSLGLLALGGIFLALWRGRGRLAGLAPAALGLALWAGHERPDILIADSGRLFGIMTGAGRVLSSAEGNGFAAASWLEDDGDVATQAEAHARGGLVRRRHRIRAEAPGLGQVLYVGTKDAAGAAEDCAAGGVLIAPNWTAAPEGPCLFVGLERLRREGALAIHIETDGPRVEGALTAAPSRPWTGDPAGQTAAPSEGSLRISAR
jgi:competence protein ComEC